MYLSIILLPLLGSIVSGFFGRKSGTEGSRFIACLSIIITTILALVAFFEVGFNNNSVSIVLFEWLVSESINIIWSFQFDSLTVSMLIPVLIISSLVHIYSIGYMNKDPHNPRFFSYLSLFTFMMIILVTGDSYLLMFVGWEGVGVCSYLLVSFWFTRIAANQSSLSAFITNRVGDCFFTLGMFGIIWCLGDLNYTTVFSLSPYLNINIITLVGICLLIGATAKSSQIGLHVWLPMAMEGPTPVSALIHAATMVTAGVYLLIRSSPLIEYSSTLLLICLWLGAITTLFSSIIGLFQGDIKKIIAYSTMSQLGLMVISIGLSSYNLALFHLINHAFYKGLLFLGAGAVIHAVIDNQDLRKYGGLIHWLPLTYSVILIASLSLIAFPFMTGFFSKDFILESSYGQLHFHSIAVYTIAVIGAIFTTLYSVKILYLTFLTNPNGPINYYKNAHEGDLFMSIPLIILALFSIYFGFLTKDIYVGLGSGFFNNNSIFIHPLHEIFIDTEFSISLFFKLLPLILTLLTLGLSILIFELNPFIVNSLKLNRIGYNIFGLFNQRFLIELFYNKFIVNLILILGGQTTKILDKGSIELTGPFGIEKFLVSFSKILNYLNNGIVTNYALYIIIGMMLYLIQFSSFFIFNLFICILLSFLIIHIHEFSRKKFFNHIILKSNFFNLKDRMINLKKLILNIIVKNKTLKIICSKKFWILTRSNLIHIIRIKILTFIIKSMIYTFLFPSTVFMTIFLVILCYLVNFWEWFNFGEWFNYLNSDSDDEIDNTEKKNEENKPLKSASDMMAEMASRMQNLLISKTEEDLENVNRDLKKDDLFFKEDENLEEEDKIKKKELLNQKDVIIQYMNEDSAKMAQDVQMKSDELSSSNKNKRSLNEVEDISNPLTEKKQSLNSKHSFNKK